MRKEQCAQRGPRGGRCRNRQRFDLDFCAKHTQMVLDGKPQFCVQCNEMVTKEVKS